MQPLIMKDQIRPPIKVSSSGLKLKGDAKPYRWKLNVPASITGTKKVRLFFPTEKAAKEKRDEPTKTGAKWSATVVRGILVRESKLALAA